MIVRELFAKLGLEFDDSKFKKVDERIEGLKSSLETLAISMAGASATLFGFAKLTADAGEEALKTATRLGLGVEELQRLETAASFAGVSSEELTQGLGNLSRQMVAAQQGSLDASRSLRKAGIDLNAFHGRLPTTAESLKLVSDRFEAMPNGPQKAALAMELFGRSGGRMIPFLNQGSAAMAEAGRKADEYGTVLTKAQAIMSTKFNDTLHESELALKGLRNALGVGLMPVIRDLLIRFNEFVSKNRLKLVEQLSFIFKGLSRYVEITWKVLTQAAVSIGHFISAFGGLERIAVILGTISAVFATGKLLYSMGSLVLAVWEAVAAFTAMDVLALAIPILIGAAVIALGLIIEDIVTFFQGGQSFFGDFLKKFPVLGKAILGVFSLVKSVVMETVQAFATLFSWVEKVASYALKYLAPVFSAIGDAVSSVGDKVGKYLGGFDTTGALDHGKADHTASLIPNMLSNGPLGNFTPSSSPTTPTSQVLSSPVKIDSQMTFQVGPNTDPTQVAPQLQSSIDRGFDSLLRQTQRSFLGAPAN